MKIKLYMVLALAFASVVPNMLAMENEKHIPDTKNKQFLRYLSFAKRIEKERIENLSPRSHNTHQNEHAPRKNELVPKEEMMFEMDL